jgi:hypothetical protein
MPLASTSVLNVGMKTCNAKEVCFLVVAIQISNHECTLLIYQVRFISDYSSTASSLAFDKSQRIVPSAS